MKETSSEALKKRHDRSGDRWRAGRDGYAVEVKKIPTGAGSGMSDSAKAYLDEQTAQRAERNRLAEEEAKRQETLNVERQKAAAARAQARAAEEQAAAQRATARAIWATGRR